MVLAKTQIRSRIEAENAQREKKIAQLNEFIARFSAGTRSSQVTSRKKEVERLQTSELAKSNIQRPYIRFDMKRPSGRHPLEIKGLSKAYGDLKVIDNFTASVSRGEKVALMGRNGAGKTTLLKSLIRSATGCIDDASAFRCGRRDSSSWGHEVAVGYFSQDHSDSIAKRHDRHRVAARVRSAGLAGGTARLARPDAVQRRRRAEADQSALGRRSGAPDLLPPHAAEAERSWCSTSRPITSTSSPSTPSTSRSRSTKAPCCWSRHDHDLIEEVATRIWHFEDGRIEDFKGPYEEYVAYAQEKAS